MLEDSKSVMNDAITRQSIGRHMEIGICTSSLKSNIEAFIAMVSGLTNVTVRFIELPYNDLDSFRLSSAGLDGVIICHSINNRRFAITDVMDALYDNFLPHVREVFGKANVCVIAHDFSWPMGTASAGSLPKDHATIKDTYMGIFRSNQPTTFDCCKLAMICGALDKQVDIDREDWKQLEVFLHQCRVHPESFIDPSDAYKSPPDPDRSKLLIFLTKSGVFAYVTSRITAVSAFSPVKSNVPLPDSVPTSQASQGLVGSIIGLVWFPFKIVLTMRNLILSWTRSDGASLTMWTSFRKDVLDKTLEWPKSPVGLFGILYWICSMPSRLAFYSYKFAVTLVGRFFWGVGKYCLVAVAAYIMIPLTAKVYIGRHHGHIEGNENTTSNGESLHWSAAPWWNVPFRFWRHICHIIYG
eukprot:XP_011676346.1 PREDICTED: uncharacterized protein LOC100892197 [Strongylocentrotus purpuratus]